MAQGVSLHIGVNAVDPNSYGGWTGDLEACEYDALDMQLICAAQGLQARTLLTAQATADAVLSAVEVASGELGFGDLFVVTFSGFGGQVPDVRGGAPDGLVKSWVLQDRQLLGRELHHRWGSFAQGVRIVVLADTCFSGSVVKAQLAELDDSAAGDALRSHTTPDRLWASSRFMPQDCSSQDYTERRSLYDEIMHRTQAEAETPLAARVLRLSGCQDNQTCADGERNGLFTGTLRKVWDEGEFSGGYRRFLTEIRGQLPPWQSPNYTSLNDPSRLFNAERPFTP